MLSQFVFRDEVKNYKQRLLNLSAPVEGFDEELDEELEELELLELLESLGMIVLVLNVVFVIL